MRFHKLLIRTQSLHFKKCTYEFRSLGLSPGQPKILEVLRQQDGYVQKELAKACEVEPATITSILPSMEKNDLILREVVFDCGKRSLEVKLTEKGKELGEKVDLIMDEVEELSFRGFTAEEKDTFLSLLERVYTNMM